MTKKYFEPLIEDGQIQSEQLNLQQKKEFATDEIFDDVESENNLSGLGSETGFEQQIQRNLAPQPRWWKTALMATAGLFLIAVVAQSVQWLLDSWQQNQWIHFAFAIVMFSVVILGVVALGNEFRRLFKLKRLLRLQQQSRALYQQSAVGAAQQSGEQAQRLCLQIAENMQLTKDDLRLQQWQKQLSEVHTAEEVGYLFSQNVLSDRDRQARSLVSKGAAEAAIVVGISPLAVVDLFFVAWRNLALINKIAALYGIELGYFSRIRLLRMVLLNMAFAGATELVHDIGMDWLSKDLMAKLSARAAQGLGVGLLTARLGIKTMEFCRPLAFQADEKPRLSIIHQELLTSLKSTLSASMFSSDKTKTEMR
ncbi:TIGR01620 family protein [Testudinibacter sp. TR-2022]|uniref:TIGR01620 family protein n=1 Tax=Testudinibacter sp. TR-2022 TaxID=2585029 RepID=UPI001117EAF5|nr:TIGR01620 family protein [Testudinibacter sp. TR-2022]TNH02901.1 TIGR01620 family protein [Pasteurellaceae bacterium Phil31]TNH12099.1 TIGR01620 family protein [Testudinibacter sp. TR-2022]TNH13265.1 TIGR01620 family protein [Testudinibacter sp. TR-2022]TNH13545.1 TIGR01620 family protein [Testudinibacter sp. TR-2022]TNH17366.1 TIGR01620 family protein [Testudinibacter sp. TR-2022]